MANKGGAALGFTLLVLLGAIAIPAAVDSTNTTEIDSAQIDIGETHVFATQIDITVIDSTNTEAELRVTDRETGESEDVTVTEGNSTDLDFELGTITITNDISNNSGATLIVEYPSIYGFSPAAETIADNLAIILVSMLFIAIMAFVGVKK